MKKILLFLLLFTLVLSSVQLPIKAHAAPVTAKAGIVSTVSGSLRVRAGTSTEAPVITSLQKGSYIMLLEKMGPWWKVAYDKNAYGYCHGDYIRIAAGNPATVNTQSGNLNVRSGAGTAHKRIGSIPKGERVVILSSSAGWSRILYHGIKTGYVSTQYLSSTQSGNEAISLNVPSFKQTDSRWANVKIGSSGKTMAQIGCATTAIAMMESYRTGTTIYPNMMTQKLSYTASGNVYWPKHFATVANSNGYLNSVYEQLKQGKPVLLGARNSYGGQHWVVIIGFSGGSLQPVNFTILDPGSSSRTNLQQFLNAYPNFYKYFYYQ